MIRAVFFDAAGVLYTRSGPTLVFALALLNKRGFCTDISIEKETQLSDIRAQANKGMVNHEVYWDQFLLFRGVMDPDQRKQLCQQIITYSNDVQAVPGARESLEILKSKGIFLGVITDTMYPVEWKMRRLEKAGVASLIDRVACSTDLGIHKPDPLVYQYAIKQTPYLPEQCAFVGHLDVELQGAHSTGMITIAVNHEEGVMADYYCGSMRDLPRLPLFS